jgi:hypothetical protein
MRTLPLLALSFSSLLYAFPVEVLIGEDKKPVKAEWTPTGNDSATLQVAGKPPILMRGPDVESANERHQNASTPLIVPHEGTYRMARVETGKPSVVKFASWPTGVVEPASVEVPVTYWKISGRTEGDRIPSSPVSVKVEASKISTASISGSPELRSDAGYLTPDGKTYIPLQIVGFRDGKALFVKMEDVMRLNVQMSPDADRGTSAVLRIFEAPPHLLAYGRAFREKGPVPTQTGGDTSFPVTNDSPWIKLVGDPLADQLRAHMESSKAYRGFTTTPEELTVPEPPVAPKPTIFSQAGLVDLLRGWASSCRIGS